MLIMKKEVKTAAGIVTITATQVDPSLGDYIKYTARLEINGGVLAISKVIPTYAMNTEEYPSFEWYLLRDLAVKVFEEIK